METNDIYQLLAALRYCNSQLSALVSAIENPEFYDLEKSISHSYNTIERADKFQLSILDKYRIHPINLPAYTWGSNEQNN